MSSPQISPGMFLTAVAMTLGLAVSLGEIYSIAIAKFHVSPWIGVVAAHSLLALILIIIRKPVREALRLKGGPITPWLVGPVVLIGAVILSVSTKSSGPLYAPTGSSEIYYALATLTVIPLMEEIVFRCGVSPFISRFVGGWWAIWFASIVFSMAHTLPTWDRLAGLKVGLPLGPFLLALCCDVIVRRWGRVWPAVVFHSACNATVYIFAGLNPSWLRHFGGLYM